MLKVNSGISQRERRGFDGKVDKVLAEYFKDKKEVFFAYLFGSSAKGTDNRLSDIDIAVFIDEKQKIRESGFGYESDMITDLIKVLKRNDIDVVVLNKAKLFLSYQVLRYGKLVFSRDNKTENHFRFKVYQEYLDTKRIRDINNYYFKKRIQNNG